MATYARFNKALAALVTCALSAAAVIFHKDLGVSPEVIAEITPFVVSGLVYLIPNIAPEIADGGKLDQMEQLTADIATTVKDNVNAAHGIQVAAQASQQAQAALGDPAVLRAPDGMQRPS